MVEMCAEFPFITLETEMNWPVNLDFYKECGKMRQSKEIPLERLDSLLLDLCVSPCFRSSGVISPEECDHFQHAQ